MMHLTKSDIEKTERIKRLNLINSISGIKPGNLIGSIAADGSTNVAIFSSVVHLGSHPALLGFIMRPQIPGREGDTYRNIKATGQYTINHIHRESIERAHYTSAKFDAAVSEFDACKITPWFHPSFTAPFVAESEIKIGMRYLEEVPIAVNNTILMIGEVEHLFFPGEAMDEEGHLRPDRLNGVGISGLNNYCSLSSIGRFPYAKVDEVPKF